MNSREGSDIPLSKTVSIPFRKIIKRNEEPIKIILRNKIIPSKVSN